MGYCVKYSLLFIILFSFLDLSSLAFADNWGRNDVNAPANNSGAALQLNQSLDKYISAAEQRQRSATAKEKAARQKKATPVTNPNDNNKTAPGTPPATNTTPKMGEALCAEQGKSYDANARAADGGRGDCVPSDPVTLPAPKPPGDTGMESCLSGVEAKVAQCKSQGSSAVTSCNKENTTDNQAWGAASEAFNLGSQVLQAKAQQSGSAKNCFQMATLSTAVWAGMEKLKGDCTVTMSACNNSCEEARTAVANISNTCAQHRNNIYSLYGADAAGANAAIAEFDKNLNAEANNLNSQLEEGSQSCNVTAKNNEKILGDSMKKMNDSAQQAAQCDCNISGGQQQMVNGSCEDIMGPEYCANHPEDLQKCPVAVAPAPAGAAPPPTTAEFVPPEKATNPGASALAGSGFNPIAATSPNFKGSAGIGNLDLGDERSGSISSDKSQYSASSPFGAAAGGGAGGGGAAPGPGGEGGGDGTGEPGSQSGIAGLFNNLKTGIANAFGGGKNSGNSRKFSDKNKNGKEVDPNDWRPAGLRGVAGGSGMGTRNMDIFKMIQTRYGDQYHTFNTVEWRKPK
jgi:hypothetical protein